MGIIYCYTNKINNKKYIGQTINPEQRYNQHKSSAYNEKDKDYESIFHRAIRKYDWDGFDYEILEESDDLGKLNLLEIYYINLYNTKIPNGYNVLDGGNNASRPKSEETKIKLSQAKAMLTDSEIIFLRNAYKNYESPTEIYKELYSEKMHFNSFLNIWTGQKYKHIMPEAFSKGKRQTKYTPELILEIRRVREEEKLTYQQLADKYSIPKPSIADIIKRRTWKNV